MFNKKKLFCIRPRDEKDYYKCFRWMISKRLVTALIFILGFISLAYLISVKLPQLIDETKEGVRVFDYDSILLRYKSGTVKIRAEAGYIAYEGEVSSGRVNGFGTLFSSEGTTVYIGEFQDNEYSGSGTLYDSNSDKVYEGQFLNNLYEGEGKEYRENGICTYEGNFHKGKRDGQGKMFNVSGELIYEGNFVSGNILYSDFLGKNTEEAGKIYQGHKTIYYDDSTFVVKMDEINIYYSGQRESGSLDDTVTINKVFIVGDNCFTEGSPVYEGKMYMNMEEASVLQDISGLETEKIFDDAFQVTGYDRESSTYIYTYRYEGLQYTVYCKEKNGEILMYSIEWAQE